MENETDVKWNELKMERAEKGTKENGTDRKWKFITFEMRYRSFSRRQRVFKNTNFS